VFKLVTKFSLCLIILLLISCNHESMESEFFDWETFDYDKLYNYSLEDQFKIFIYGNQTIHPSMTDLAIPIAKRGKPALDYVLNQIRESNDDLDYRDSIVIFWAMEKGGYYSVCSDTPALKEIKANENKIKFLGWRKVYHNKLQNLCVERQSDG